MMVLFDFFNGYLSGKNELKLILFWSSLILCFFLTTISEHTKNNNFDKGRITRTCILGAQKNCLIKTILLNA